jgi:hypothetical protein
MASPKLLSARVGEDVGELPQGVSPAASAQLPAQYVAMNAAYDWVQ